jgi:L-malate glycosyltransferase
MNILHISSEKSWRGGEQQIAYLIKGSPDVRHYVFCRSNSAFEAYCKENSIEHATGSFHPMSWILSALKVKNFCAEKSIKIIHLHTAKAHLLGYVVLLMGVRIPMVVSRRVAVTPSRSLTTRMRYNHPQMRRIIGISEEITRVMKSYVADPDKVITIHSGIDIYRFTAPSFVLKNSFHLAETTQIVGTVSALSSEKDLKTFLKVAKEIQETGMDVHYFIVGDGPLRAELEGYCLEQKLINYVTFTGHVSNPGDYLQQFDLFLFTSVLEGLGTSVLDAFACKIPVVASHIGGIPEIVINEQTGLTVAPGDVAGFKVAVIRLLRDKDLATAYTSSAYSHLQNFTYQRMAVETVACYSSVLNP